MAEQSQVFPKSGVSRFNSVRIVELKNSSKSRLFAIRKKKGRWGSSRIVKISPSKDENVENVDPADNLG